MRQSEIKEILEDSLKEEKFLEFTSAILKALKMVGGTVAQYYMFKSLINSIMMDKKFTNQLADQIAKKLDVYRRKTADTQLNPTVPRTLKGYGNVDIINRLSPTQSKYRLTR